jgi:hypothetical protein
MIRNEAERDRIEKAPDEAGAIAIRDRIRELRRVKARDLVPHPKKLAQTSPRPRRPLCVGS